MKTFKQFNKVNESASDFIIGDDIIYTFDGKEYTGKIVDHFGEGVMLQLDKSLRYPSNYMNFLLCNWDSDNTFIYQPYGENTIKYELKRRINKNEIHYGD